MKVSIGIGVAASGRKRDFDEQVDYVVEAEKLGVDAVWTAEAWVVSPACLSSSDPASRWSADSLVVRLWN